MGSRTGALAMGGELGVGYGTLCRLLEGEVDEEALGPIIDPYRQWKAWCGLLIQTGSTLRPEVSSEPHLAYSLIVIFVGQHYWDG